MGTRICTAIMPVSTLGRLDRPMNVCADLGSFHTWNAEDRRTSPSPTPRPESPRDFLCAAYLDIGLAAVYIEQLTGHSAEQILDLAAQSRHPGQQPQRPLPLVPAATRTSL